MRRILTLLLSLILTGALCIGTALHAQATPSTPEGVNAPDQTKPAATLPAPAASSTSDGVYTPDQAKRGDTAYQKTCASCHSDDLAGNGQSPPLSGDVFISNWQGQSMRDLFDKIQTSMPADNPGSLTRPQTADILAYILSANKFPAAQAELPMDEEALKHIRIDKPPAAPGASPRQPPAAPGGSPGQPPAAPSGSPDKPPAAPGGSPEL